MGNVQLWDGPNGLEVTVGGTPKPFAVGKAQTWNFDGDQQVMGNTDASKFHLSGVAAANGGIATLLGGGDFAHYCLAHNFSQDANGVISAPDDVTSTSYAVVFSDNGYHNAYQAPAAATVVLNATPTFSLNLITGVMTLLGKFGYVAGGGAGATVTQTASRTTGVTINKPTGNVKLVSTAGSVSWQTFTVSNTQVTAADTIIVNQQSGTDLYQVFVTNVTANAFNISFATTGGTTTEQPVFNFNVIKGSST